MRSRARAIPALAVVALVATGCIGKDPYEPGTALGTFHVVGKLAASSCGPANAPDPWEFDVKLSTEPGKLYWIQGSVPVSGTLDASAHFTMSDTAAQNVDASDAGPGACDLARDDGLTANLTKDPANPNGVSAFSGTLTYKFHAAADSVDCSDQLASNGGAFPELPCSIAYTLAATRTALPNQYGK